MTTMPNVMNNHTPLTMSTPINNLPLKTSQTEEDIDDPMIQNVLKEFENDMIGDISPEQTYHIQTPQQAPQPTQYIPQQVNHQQTQTYDSIKFNSATKKKLIDIEFAKKAAIITIIMYLIYYCNILQYIMKLLPEPVLTHITGRECIVSTLMIFVIIYSLLYFEII